MVSSVPLALLLLRASRWFDRRLLEGLQRQGWPALTPAQSLVFAHLDPAGVTPAELARRLGHSRQATAQLVAGLLRHDLLVLGPNPARRGGRLVLLTDRGHRLTADARQLLARLESDLADDLGPNQLHQLRAVLDSFGDDPSTGRTDRRAGR